MRMYGQKIALATVDIRKHMPRSEAILRMCGRCGCLSLLSTLDEEKEVRKINSLAHLVGVPRAAERGPARNRRYGMTSVHPQRPQAPDRSPTVTMSHDHYRTERHRGMSNSSTPDLPTEATVQALTAEVRTLVVGRSDHSGCAKPLDYVRSADGHD